MQITAAATTSQTTTTDNSTAKNSSSDLSSMFMQLLIAELKSQNPSSPQDPTQFVGQLVQFNSLSELEKIRSLLQTAAGATTAEGQTAPTTGGK